MTVWGSALVVLLAAQPLFTFQDPRINESSALVDGGDVVFTINDSGDSGRVFVVDKQSGETVGVTTYGASPVDVEALSAGPDDTLWVGDIGDNNAVRSHITVYRIPTPGRGEESVTPTVYELVYDNGPRDAETLAVDPRTGRLYVVSKGLLGGTVYVAPRQLRADRTNVLQRVGSVGGLVTDGVFLPDGRHLLIRDYSSATILRTRDFTPVAMFRLPAQEQGEGIGYDGERVLVSTEGERSRVHAVELPARALRALEPTPTRSPTPAPPPNGTEHGVENDPGNGVASGAKVVPWALVAGWVLVGAFAVRWLVRRRG